MLKQAAKVNSNFRIKSFEKTMKKVISQIYEIQTPAEAELMVRAGVDHVGSVILSVRDWKQAEIKRTIDLVAETEAKSSLILLYHDPDLVFQSLDYYQPDIVHFCEILIDNRSRKILDAECDALVWLQAQIKIRFPEIKIMRTIPLPDQNTGAEIPYLEMAAKFESVSDYFLTDTLLVSSSGSTDQPVNGFVGITGKTCEWRSAARLVEVSQVPVVLAGGLSPENVYQGILEVKPSGADSCTLTNARGADGRPIRFQKDLARVNHFLSEIRKASEEL